VKVRVPNQNWALFLILKAYQRQAGDYSGILGSHRLVEHFLRASPPRPSWGTSPFTIQAFLPKVLQVEMLFKYNNNDK
jgi:hypothetical protein